MFMTSDNFVLFIAKLIVIKLKLQRVESICAVEEEEGNQI